jgi:tetratricopeptide (TPR) repeat protein
MLIDWNISQRFVPGFNDRIDGIQLDLFLLGKIAYYLVTGSYPGDPPLTKWQREAFDKTLSINDMRERYGVPPVIVFGPYKHILRDQFKEIIKKALNKQYSEAIKMRADLEALPPIYRSTNKHTAAAHEAIRDGRYDDAFDALNQVIDHDPDDYEAFILLIWVRLARKQLSTKKNKGNTSST